MSSFIRAKIPQAARFFHSSQGLLSPSGWSWRSQMRKAGGTAVMYFPVVTAAFFWPYAVAPVMNIRRRVKNIKPENKQQ